MTATIKQLRRTVKTVKMCASLMRELAHLLWWASVALAVIGLTIHALLSGDLANMVDLLDTLRPG